MAEHFRLPDLRPGQRARVHALLNESGMRRRLLDMGLIENTVVECLGKSPFGDPAAYLIRGAVVAIRAEDGEKIILREDS